LRKTNHPVVSNRDGFVHTLGLQDEEEVKELMQNYLRFIVFYLFHHFQVVWAQQLFRKTRVKRGHLRISDLIRGSDRNSRDWPVGLEVPKDWLRKEIPR